MSGSGKAQGRFDQGSTSTGVPYSTFYFLKSWIAGLGLGFVMIFVPALGETIHKEKNAVVTESLDQRGKQLREAIEQEYQRLEVSKKLTTRNDGDITAIVSKFIPVDTPFDEAEQILRSAGFDVGSRFGPNSPIDVGFRLPNPRYELTARIIALHGSISLRTVSVFVFLTPENPNTYIKVNEVRASIHVSYP